MYPPHHLGGYELTWRSAVEHLRHSGYQVRVVTTDYRDPRPEAGTGEGSDVHRELRWYWQDHRFPRIGLRALLELERHNAQVLDRHLETFSPHVVNWWAMGGMSLSLIERARAVGIPAVGVVGDDWMSYGPRVDGWSRLFRTRPFLGRTAERITRIPTRVDPGAAGSWLFNSETTRRRAQAAGWSLPDSDVAYPGVDLGMFHPAPERTWRGRLLYVGRIDERKGIDTALRSLSLQPSGTVLSVLGRGDEDYLARLRSLAITLGVEQRVTFSSVLRPELARRYAAADALIFPVRWEEPWGLVPLEAMASGTPVVATGTGGSGEYLNHERNCLLYEPRDDPQALAAALDRLAREPALRRRLRDGGLATATRFDQDSYNEAIREAIDRAAGRWEASMGVGAAP